MKLVGSAEQLYCLPSRSLSLPLFPPVFVRLPTEEQSTTFGVADKIRAFTDTVFLFYSSGLQVNYDVALLCNYDTDHTYI